MRADGGGGGDGEHVGRQYMMAPELQAAAPSMHTEHAWEPQEVMDGAQGAGRVDGAPALDGTVLDCTTEHE